MLKIPVKIIYDYPEKPKENRTIIYIDGQNFLHRCAESLIKSGAIEDQHELTNIDIRYIFKKLFPEDNLEIRYYSVSKTKFREEKDEKFNIKAKKITDSLRLTKANLNNQGIKLINAGQLKIRSSNPCEKCGHISLKFQEKGVDVGLAVDMIENAMLGLTNKAILVSSDIDLLPAVKSNKKFGVEVIYVGMKGSMTKSLISCASSTREISNITILEAYTSALNFAKKC